MIMQLPLPEGGNIFGQQMPTSRGEAIYGIMRTIVMLMFTYF